MAVWVLVQFVVVGEIAIVLFGQIQYLTSLGMRVVPRAASGDV